MTKLEALKALAEKVEAGDLRISSLLPSEYERMWPKFYHAANGSLDAAKALHEAVLPGWHWNISNDNHAAVWGPSPSTWSAYSTTPARAWLLSILKALIAQEALQDLADADRDII